MLEDVIAMMQVKAYAKGVDLRLESGGKAGAACWRVLSDPVRLKQILVNLVGNAIKFTEHGSVTVRAWTTPDHPKPSFVVEITDSGIGMTPEQMEGLFGAFSQADASVTRRFGGSGLGLRISRSLALLMGGDIAVRSTPCRGSTFSLTLPAEPAPAPESSHRSESPRTPAPRSRPLAGKRIFLVEDGLDNQRLIDYQLRSAGADVTLFDNGLLALQALTENASSTGSLRDPPPCDLVVTDMQMPVMDGYTLASTLRQKGWTVPIIALTAHAMSDDAARCLAAGGDAYASKPINRQALIGLCAEVLGPGRHERGHAQAA